MAVSARPNTAPVYDAVQQWLERCLRHDDSLFTPGAPIWSLGNVEELKPRGTITGDGFEDKLRDRLQGAPPAVVQLAAEMLYIHLVMSNDMQEETKRGLIDRILSVGGGTVVIPSDLADALGTGWPTRASPSGRFAKSSSASSSSSPLPGSSSTRRRAMRCSTIPGPSSTS